MLRVLTLGFLIHKMVDLRVLFFLYSGILGLEAFDAGDPKVKVERYTTEIFVQRKSRVILDCSIRTQSRDMLFSWTKDGQGFLSQTELPQRRKFNWTKDAQDLKPQGRVYLAENGSLIIERTANKKKKKKNDEGFYECFGDHSDFGTVIGRRVHLKIQRPAFTIVPHNLSASVGGVARFHCQDNLKSEFYVWHPYQEHDSRILSFTGILQITNVTLEDAGQYVCKAFPRLDQPLEKIMETTVRLTINTDPLPTTPRFLNTSQRIIVQLGHPALLECLAEGQRPFKLKWIKDGIPLKEENQRVTIVGNSNVKFLKTNSSDSGRYACSLESGQVVLERVYQLDILVPPKIRTAPKPDFYNYVLVQRTRLSCIATGNPEPSIVWYKDGLKLYPAPTLQLKNELVLFGQHADSGYYQCIAENEVGIDIATTYIRFNRKPETPDKPRNVKAVPISGTEVNITWSPADTQGGFEVVAYGIDFHEVHEFSCSGMCAHLFDRIRDVSNHNFKIIGNLKPYTMYSFAVQGYSGNGAGLLSEEVIVRTLEAVPTTVPDVQIIPDTRTSIRVIWTEIPVEHRHGVIDRYKLWHGTREKMTVLELDGTSRNYLITGLEPDTAYRIRVLAGNAAGYPEFNVDKEVWIEYQTPRAPPRVFPTPTLTFEAVNSTSVLMTWNCLQYDAVESYRITVQKLLESSAVQEINISADVCQFLLTTLENSTFYKIELIVKNVENMAIGIVTELYQSLAPGIDQQPPPPMDIDLKLLTSTLIGLEWEKPRTSLKITKYTVMYRKQTDDKDAVRIQSPTLTARLEGLSAFTWYVIAVKSHTESAEGPFSKPVIVQTKEGIPSPPENLLAEVLSPGTVRLQWGPPKKQNGIIRYYIIYYNVDKDQPDQVWNSIQQNASKNTVVVQDLKSKVYYFKLRACTNAGEGMSSHIVAIDTLACSEAPCPQCQPPEDCKPEVTDQMNNVVTGILQQKLGIIIGCAIGLTCIILCIIFVIRFRRVSSRRSQAGHPNTVSNPCNDNIGRYLSEPLGNENGSFIRYSPLVKELVENKNSDTKGGDYVFMKRFDPVMMINGRDPDSIYVQPQACAETKQLLEGINIENEYNTKTANDALEVDETSAFLEPNELAIEDTELRDGKESDANYISEEGDCLSGGNTALLGRSVDVSQEPEAISNKISKDLSVQKGKGVTHSESKQLKHHDDLEYKHCESKEKECNDEGRSGTDKVRQCVKEIDNSSLGNEDPVEINCSFNGRDKLECMCAEEEREANNHNDSYMNDVNDTAINNVQKSRLHETDTGRNYVKERKTNMANISRTEDDVSEVCIVGDETQE